MLIARKTVKVRSWITPPEYEYRYYVIKDGILYEYPSIDTKKWEKLTTKMLPSSFYIVKEESLAAIKNVCSYASDITTISGTLEEHKLELYVPYFHEKIKVEKIFDKDITDEIKEKIKKIDLPYPIVIVGENFNRLSHKNTSVVEERYCTKCGKFFYPEIEQYGYLKLECPKCNKNVRNNEIVMTEFREHRKKYLSNGWSNLKYSDIPSTKKTKFYYMFSVENGIILYAMSREIIAKKNTIYEKISVEYSIEHIIGKNIATYKHLKKGKKPCDPFEALNINSKNIMCPPEILYEDSEDFFEFASKNEKFLKMSGFQDVMKYSSMELKMEPFFIAFIGIMNRYPILEQLVKMGHARLFFTLYESMLNSTSKAEIDSNVEKIGRLIDKETTKGKNALRFPVYISDYLIRKNAELDEYYYWADLYEMTNMDKTQFEKITDSLNFAWINSQAKLADICNILKFDYPIEKLFSYIIKQAKQNNKISIGEVIRYLTDYLNMCDICNLEADKYPQNIKKQHDDMSNYFKERKKAQYDKMLNDIGTDCENYVIPDEEELNKVGIPKLFETMTVVFPKSEADFINEGNQQHNCVGSYPRSVRNGNCVIFFIRYKDRPDRSFITAECTNKGLGQCFYANNRRVEDENLMKFAKYIANKIKTGCNSGKIRGLSNIQK